MTVHELLGRLQSVRRNGGGWLARCPAHDDRKPSLSIHEVNGTILLKCFAGCAFDEIVAVLGLEKPDFFAGSSNGRERPSSVYDYVDETRKLLYQVVRFEPKHFKQRRPDGNGGWIWKLDGVRRVLYNLPAVLEAKAILVVEGEKDVETARGLGLVATCNSGGGGKWKPEFSEYLKGKRVAIIADADPLGLAHARDVARALLGVTTSVRLVEAVPQGKDLTEWVERGGTRERLIGILRAVPDLTAGAIAGWGVDTTAAGATGRAANPWAEIEGLDSFLRDDGSGAEALEAGVLYQGAVAEIFSPRGLGKSLYALALAVKLARADRRVLLLDRDNPRRVVRERLEGWGADGELTTLNVLSRERCPTLTNPAAWALFPYADFNVVILDSLDSHAEGVGEQDSGKPSRAIAPLLDVAHREGGPAVLVLGNCIRSGKHSRGSGVVEDRADIVYEVRDATGFTPSGNKPWVEELPPAGADAWASRANRRKRRENYRLAFVPSKFKIGEEPDAFIIELNLGTSPWSMVDVTDEVDRQGAEARAERETAWREKIASTTESLVAEITRRTEAGEPPLLKKKAEALLHGQGLTRMAARQALKDGAEMHWQFISVAGKGHPQAVIKCESGRNTTRTGPAQTLARNDAYFGRPLFMHPAEIDPSQAQCLSASESPGISAAHANHSPRHAPVPATVEEEL